MPCEQYQAIKDRLHNAMREQDRAHYDSHASIKAHDKALTETRFAVERVELESTWHIQGCDECKAERNEPFTAAPM